MELDTKIKKKFEYWFIRYENSEESLEKYLNLIHSKNSKKNVQHVEKLE